MEDSWFRDGVKYNPIDAGVFVEVRLVYLSFFISRILNYWLFAGYPFEHIIVDIGSSWNLVVHFKLFETFSRIFMFWTIYSNGIWHII